MAIQLTNQPAGGEAYTALVAALQAQFQRPVLSPGEALAVIPGPAQKDPENSANQRIFAGTYPFKVSKIGRRRAVLITDIAARLLEVDAPPNAPPAAAHRAPRRPGRPRAQAAAPEGVSHV